MGTTHLTTTIRTPYSGTVQVTDTELRAARAWVDDCLWADLDLGEAWDLSPVAIVRGVDVAYDGGWIQFIADAQVL